MKRIEAKKFNIPALNGISPKNIEEHIKLYEGYVKHANLIIDSLIEATRNNERDTYTINEMTRRFSFEYNGVRNHEIYFSSLEGGAKDISPDSALSKAINEQFGSFEKFMEKFKASGLVRGIGWVVLSLDQRDGNLLLSWIDEQHIGELNNCPMILAMDMWEHAYVADYQPSGKKKYIDDFISNVNWKFIEGRFEGLSQ